MKACGLSEPLLPSRRTFDRRLKTVSIDIKERITTMGGLFVSEGLVKPHVLSIDSTLVESKGHVWHKSSMEKDIVLRSGIDTEMPDGASAIRKDGYLDKLHLISSWFFPVYIPLSADVTTAKMCMTIKSLSSTNIPFTCHNN